MKRIAGIVVLCAFGTLCVSGGTWQSVNGEWNGAFSDAGHWNGGLAADGGENAISAQSHDVTVSVDSATETTARLILTGYADKPAVLDVTGASLLFASQTVDSVTWPVEAFYGRFDGYSFFQDKSDDSRWNKQAQAKLSDVAVKIWSPEAGIAEMLVTGGENGVFDFVHPDPRGDTKAENGARPTVTLFQADYYKPERSSYNHARLKFVDTAVSFPSLTIANYAPVCELAVSGGSLACYGNVSLGAKTNLVTLSRGATFSFEGSANWNGFGPATSFSMDDETTLTHKKTLELGGSRTMRFTGGTVTSTVKDLFSGAGMARFELKDTTLSRDSEVAITMQESSVFSAENTTLSDNAKFTVKTTGDARILLDGCTLTTLLMAGSDGATLKLKDTTVNVGNWGLSNASVTMDGGSFGTDGQFYFSGNGSSYVLTNVTGVTKTATCAIGGSTVTFAADSLDRKLIANGNGHAQIGYTAGQEGVLNITGGTFEFRPSGTANRFNLGHGLAAATGRLNVTGGRFVSKVTTDGTTRQFGLGITHGTGFITVSGGEVDVSGLCICTEENATAPESVFRQTGGLVKVAGCAYQSSCQSYGLCATGNGKTTRKARLALDGGVTETSVIAGGTSGQCRGGTGWTAFEADGGFVRVNYAQAEILRDFDEATIGANGLTVDGNGYDVHIRQSLASKDGVRGRLRLTGAGTKTVYGANNLEVVADGGVVSFALAADNSNVDLVATNGVAVVFGVGASKNTTLKSLVLGDDATMTVLTLAAGQTLTVAGDVTVGSVVLNLSGTFATGTSYSLLSCGGEISDASKDNWIHALATGLGADQGCDLRFEEVEGRQVLKMDVREKRTLEIVVPANVTSNSAEAISYSVTDALSVDVGASGTFVATGRTGLGSLAKTGAGRAYFDNVEDFFVGGVTVTSGLLSIPHPDGFASPSVTASKMSVGTGTLELGRPGNAPVELTPNLSIETTAASDAAVVKCDSDIATKAPGVMRGCVLKRGSGTLRFMASGTCTFSSDAGKDVKNSTPSADALAFDEFGTPPTRNYSSLTVAEGDLVLQGTTAAAKYAMGGSGAVYVGMPVQGILKPARLVVDGVKAEFTGAHFHVGSAVRTSNCPQPYATLAVTNGADVKVTSLQIGLGAAQTGKPRVRVSGEGSVLRSSEYVYLTQSVFANQDEDDPVLRVSEGATLMTPSMYDGNAAHALDARNGAIGVFDRATLCADNAQKPEARIVVDAQGDNRLVFRNGSTCVAGEIRVSEGCKLTMGFDDAEWQFGSLDALTLTRPENVTVDLRNRGIVFAPEAGKTMTFALGLSGAGGLVKTGAGKLVLAASATFTGDCRIEAGEVALADGVKATGLRLSGSGRLTGGTLENCTLLAPLGDAGAVTGAVPVVSGVAFAGRTYVDVARAGSPLEAPYPADVLIATYEGAAPNVSGWRVVNTGVKGVSGVCTAANGEIRMTVRQRGFIAIVR